MVRVRWVALVLLLAVASAAFAATPKSSSRPPRDLHRVADHWTAYNPPDPSTYPAGARTHTIVPGDTLWALAQKYFSNAYLWPQLWESNTWITDAHWIYPGDVLLIEGEAQTAEAGAAGATSGVAAGGVAPGEPELGSSTMTQQPVSAADQTETSLLTVQRNVSVTTSPVPLASEYDLYCYGYIGDPSEPMPNFIESYEDVEVRYQRGAVKQDISGSMGDLVYIAGGTSTGLVAGETYLIVEPAEFVTHPRTREALGRHYGFRGQVRIICADETRSRGMIVQSCTDIAPGARLKPMPQLPIPIARIPDLPEFCDPPSGRANGYIVNARDAIEAVGVGTLVQIDLGRDDQLQPGDFLTVWRDSPAPGQTRQVLGEVAVLTTESRTATARVVAMRRAMTIGDHVEVR